MSRIKKLLSSGLELPPGGQRSVILSNLFTLNLGLKTVFKARLIIRSSQDPNTVEESVTLYRHSYSNGFSLFHTLTLCLPIYRVANIFITSWRRLITKIIVSGSISFHLMPRRKKTFAIFSLFADSGNQTQPTCTASK